MNAAVIGAGAWGTALAAILARKGVETTLWVRERDLAREMAETRKNSSFLPGVELPRELHVTPDLDRACAGAEVFLVVAPTQFCRAVLADLKPLLPKRPAMVCASKGIEMATLSPLSTVFETALEGLKPRYAHLSGPSFALETALGMPTTVSLGCADKKLARAVQELFSSPTFRVYTTPDYRGVELGGAVKNIIAIAAGICDGLNFGHNSRAALITRGLAEMSRLGQALGARKKTFMGLSGMGDLVLTCTGDLSRNRQVGLALGRGEKLAEILSRTQSVAEGVKTTEAVHRLAQKLGVEAPITAQAYAILYKDKDPRQAVRELMSRELKEEET